MHQSGHSRAHSMQAVQLPSWRAITPRARVGGASFTCGYCTVAAPFEGAGISVRTPRLGNTVRTMVEPVTTSPLTRPGTRLITPPP